MINGTLPAGEMAIERLLKAGLKAQLTTSSLVTGQLEVNLGLWPDIHTVPIGIDLGQPEIPAIASPFEALQDQIARVRLDQLVATAQETLNTISRMSNQLGDRIGPVLDSAQKTSETARDTLQSIGGAVRQIQAETSRTLGDIDHLAVEGQEQLTDRSMQLSHLLNEVGRTVNAVDTLSNTLNDMVSPRSEARANLDATLCDLSASASSLRDFSHEIDRDPALLLSSRASR